MKKISNMLWGLVLIVLGVMIGLNSFGITQINFFFDGWWTLFIIIPCFIEMFRSRYKIINIIGIATGLALLLFCQKIFSLEMLWKLSIPTILILLGLALVFKDSLFGKKDNSFRSSKAKGGEDKHSTTFGTKSIKYDNQVFYGNDLSATFGSITCDLRNAVITEDVIINANATLGNVEILVPPTVNVEVKSSGLFGKASDMRRSPSTVTSPTISVSGMCFMGHVDIR
jgi:predicted membrane protein